MADPTYGERIAARKAQLEAEMVRVQADAARTVTELQGQIALLNRAGAALSASVEKLLNDLKGQGLL